MNRLLFKFSLVFFIVIPAFSSQAQYQYPFQNPNLDTDARIQDLIGRLTLEEKASLMVHNTYGIERLGIPAYDWWNECLHGVARAGRATIFPQAIGMAATFDADLIHRAATVISDEGRAKYNEGVRIGNRGRYNGLTFWTPNINIFRDPRWGRGHETYGEDPFLTATIGTSFMKGIQGNDPKYLKAAACAKHFAVHSGPEALRHEFNAVVNESDLRNTYLPAFKTLTQNGVAGVMCAYNRTNDEACCGGNILLSTILRKEWGFGGYIVSDCWALDDIWKFHKITLNAPETAALSIKNSVNINCGVTYKAIPEAVNKGLTTEVEVDAALTDALRILFRLGWFDPTEQLPWAKLGANDVATPKHLAVSREVAAKSIVLLKNNNILPLSKDIKSLFVTGPNATSFEALWANYFGYSAQLVTPLEGIVGKVSAATIVEYSDGCALAEDFNFRGLWKGKETEVTIAFVGLNSLLEGEEGDASLSKYKGDRNDLELPANQIEFVKKLKEAGKPVVVVVMGGSALSLRSIEPYADAILMAWYPGEQGGNAIADVLFGDVNPAGRLPLTFYKNISDLPPFDDYNMKGHTYRYFGGEVEYPFGYGLSYTSFKYEPAKLQKQKIKTDEILNLELAVVNSGALDGEEVVQLYYQKEGKDENRPLKSLVGFQRIAVPKGEKVPVCFAIPAELFEWYNVKTKQYEVEKGKYQLMIGTSSNEIKQVLDFEIR